MRCPEVRDLLHPFLDGELPVAQNVALLKHLELCTGCRQRSEEERRLAALVVGAGTERLDEAARSALLAGAFARSAASERRRVSPLLAVAAALMLALGLGGTAYATDAVCLFWGCPSACSTRRAVDHAALALIPEARQPGSEADRAAPPACAMECVERKLLAAAGSGFPERPVLRYRCKKTGNECFYVRMPGARAHRWMFRTLKDTRRYVVIARDDVRLIGWKTDDGMAFCVAPDDLPEESLTVMASRVRDAGI